MNNEILDEIIKIRKQYDSVIEEFSDDKNFKSEIEGVLEENGFDSVEEIKNNYSKTTEKDRLLKIGIVGGVKAGKSSLLNALFFEGVDILPKAATPMTAALTELTYGEEIKVTVDFFSNKDIETLKEKHSEYISDRKKIQEEEKKFEERWRRNKQNNEEPTTTERSDWKKRAEIAAKNALDKNINLSGAYDQYEMIKQSKASRKSDSEVFTLSKISDLKGKLEDYVGSKGQYMPFTSRVSLELPFKELEGISLIDTPGFNDPVPSRDKRAKDSLRECDVVLILSRTGQFLTESDKNVIEKITKKEGLRELFIVPSQIDTQLFNMEVIDDAKGNLDRAVRYIVEILNKTVRKNLEDNINDEGVFNDLINETESRNFPTSGICQSMYITFKDKNNWDEGRKKVWSNLCENYPDFFSDGDLETSRESLLKLGNIKKIDSAIQEVKGRKAEIFESKLQGFKEKYFNAAQDSKEKIIEWISSEKEKIEKGDIQSIEKNISILEKKVGNLTPEIEDKLEDVLLDWKKTVMDEYTSFLNGTKKEVECRKQDAIGEKTESWTTGHWFWKKDHSCVYTTVKPLRIQSSIDEYIHEFNERMPDFIKYKERVLRREISKEILKIMEGMLEEFDVNLKTDSNRSTVRNTIGSIIRDLPFNQSGIDVSYKGKSFKEEKIEQRMPHILGLGFGCGNLHDKSKLTGVEAEKYIDAATTFIEKCHRVFKDQLKEVLDKIESDYESCSFAKKLLKGYNVQLNEEKEKFKNKKQSMDRYERMAKKIKDIEFNNG